MSITLILMIIGCILVFAAAFNVPSKVGLFPLGVALWMLAWLIGNGAIR